MQAIFLVNKGSAAKAFETREIEMPAPNASQVLIKVDAFGLNFADVMARNGMYKEAPPMPCVLGYDVAGTITAVGRDVTNLNIGDRVTAMTRFGGYATYAIADAMATAKIPASMHATTATALTTQYCTAYFAGAEMVNLHANDKVLIHSGAGGVGTALIQLAKHKQCEIFATAGTTEKVEYLQKLGVQHPINYTTHNFEKEIERITNGKGVDVIFDAVGGKSIKKGFKSLAAGGRIVCYGAADMTGKNILGKLSAAVAFGFYHPLMFMMASKAMIGINMLSIGDNKPAVLKRCLEAVVALTEAGIFTPVIGKTFTASQIGEAHEYLEKRNSIGKIAITWQ